MGGFGVTVSEAPSFILTGFPGMEALEAWLSLPPLLLYAVSIVGNALILLVIKEEQSLHQPMRYFLSLCSLNDLGASFSTLPTVLALCFHARVTGFSACLTQMFFIHLFSWTESGILLAMSFGCYVAICNPLRCAWVLTSARIVAMGLARQDVLSAVYCVAHIGLDSALIFISYALILRSGLAIASREERLKTLHACVDHISAVLIFCVLMVSVSTMHRFGAGLPHAVHILMSVFYLFVPPMLNPVFYSIKTREIRRRLLKMLFRAKM
uniref:Olfactory receptor family 51 subfamily A member 24 n=1 Tax=Jaculus jaculus TaxID=51337 RepID=A0A8C5KQ15_JACJA